MPGLAAASPSAIRQGHSDQPTSWEPDTIAAISTPPGRGGIGIVRLAGPAAFAIAATLVRTDSPLEHARARFATVLDPDARTPEIAAGIDEAIVTGFRAPRSYTGDDLVEIAAHGSPVVLAALLQAALARGARLARPGEFTERAFLAGRLDLTQAEAVHDLIAAQTLEQARTAAQQLGGSLSRRVAPVKERLVRLLALLEAGMDFAAGELDDVESVPVKEIAAELVAVEIPLRQLAASSRSGTLRRQGASLALVGLPNAGKSSLFNRLLDRDRAIVTALAGTTRDTLEEAVSIDGVPVRLVDTAGLRVIPQSNGHAAGDDPHVVERLGMERSREALADADLVMVLHDATAPLTDEELALAGDLKERPHLLISSKVDLPGADHRWTLGERMCLGVSALTGEGLEALRAAILNALGAGGGVAEAGGLNNLRQQSAVQEALSALTDASAANSAGLPHEMLLLDLHRALSALDSLTGETTADDILARIFSTFCIGK